MTDIKGLTQTIVLPHVVDTQIKSNEQNFLLWLISKA